MKKDYLSDRLKRLPPYLFFALDQAAEEARSSGKDVIDLGVGDPDRPTPQEIVEFMRVEITDPENHTYPSYLGCDRFKESISSYMKRRFNVELNRDEILALIGTKEGIFHLPFAVTNPGDIVLYSDPGYPVYRNAAILCNANPIPLRLDPQSDFLPDFDSIDESDWRKTGLVFINYPNNPTSAGASFEFYEHLVELAHRWDFIVAHDSAYAEIYDEGSDPPVSILSIPGAKEVAIEFHSLSKSFNMTGWRIGWVCGAKEIINALSKLKTNLDSGAFTAVQKTAAFALDRAEELIPEVKKIYKERREVVVNALKKAGLDVFESPYTFYVWFRLNQKDFATRLVKDTGVLITPGEGFGEAGRGFYRIALTKERDILDIAMDRIVRYLG